MSSPFVDVREILDVGRFFDFYVEVFANDVPTRARRAFYAFKWNIETSVDRGSINLDGLRISEDIGER